MKHLDLFSGIGGFAIATEMVWDNVEHIFCDNDPFAQAILKKHWPNSLIYGDIRELTKNRILADTASEGLEGRRKATGQPIQRDRERSDQAWSVDILTGGFPCQPFSSAGRRRGTGDDRHLWPEMLRVIRETGPTYVLGENVGGFLTWDGGLVFEQVCIDLEEAGYEVCPFVIPACGLNAPHRRDRVWIAAHAKGNGERGELRDVLGKNGTKDGFEKQEQNETGKSGYAGQPPSNSTSSGSERRSAAFGKRRGGTEGRDQARTESEGRYSWNRPWIEVAAELCTIHDGLPSGLARPRGWRNAALKGAGNAIVPQVAAEVMKAIKEVSIL